MHKNRSFISVFALTLITSFSGITHASESGWCYEGHCGPAFWAELQPEFAACADGKNQSPINIEYALDAELPELQTSYTVSPKSAVNNGHTYQVNFGPGNTLLVDGRVYSLKQFHFHSPSENTIEGRSFPLECHFVHADEEGRLAVLALLFESGDSNDELAKAWSAMPTDVGHKVSLMESIDINSLLPTDRSYYRFNGSLTTPPCSEGVTWLVLKSYVNVSAEQVEQFSTTIGFANNRPVQPLNARLILE